MSRFVNRTAIDEIVLANGDRVTVRQRLTAAESADLTRNMMHLRFDSNTKQVELAEGNWHRQRIEIARAYIVSWSFTDEAGVSVPYLPALIEDLDEATITEITAAIDALQTQHREESEKKG